MGGDTLVIDCTDSFGRSEGLPTFILAHCSDTMAEVGEFVRKGQLVALSGNTGTATTGSHVHIEALPPQWDFSNGVYGRVDPETYFDEWVDDLPGGISTQGSTTTVQEDDMAVVTQAEWDEFKRQKICRDNVVTTQAHEGIPLSALGSVLPEP
jgi:hypothetical protein